MSEGDRLEQLLALQHLVCTTLDTDPIELAKADPDTRVQAIKDYIQAAQAELQEALDETGWKRWATSRHVNETTGFGELRDALQFVINAAFIFTGLSPAELATLLVQSHSEKATKNLARHAEGYDGVSGKCLVCRRAYDDEGVDCVAGYCAKDDLRFSMTGAGT